MYNTKCKGVLILTQKEIPITNGPDIASENFASCILNFDSGMKLGIVGAYFKPGEEFEEEGNKRRLQMEQLGDRMKLMKVEMHADEVIGFTDANMEPGELNKLQKKLTNLNDVTFHIKRQVPGRFFEAIGTHINKNSNTFSYVHYPFSTKNISSSNVFIRPVIPEEKLKISDHFPIEIFFKLNYKVEYEPNENKDGFTPVFKCIDGDSEFSKWGMKKLPK